MNQQETYAGRVSALHTRIISLTGDAKLANVTTSFVRAASLLNDEKSPSIRVIQKMAQAGDVKGLRLLMNTLTGNKHRPINDIYRKCAKAFAKGPSRLFVNNQEYSFPPTVTRKPYGGVLSFRGNQILTMVGNVSIDANVHVRNDRGRVRINRRKAEKVIR